MHRPTYANPPPAHSPPLHHPVPQHVSSVPHLRSPPPPQSQSQPQQHYGYPTGAAPAPSAGGAYIHPGFGGFMSDPTAQMGFQVGKSAVMAGQEYVEQNFNRYVNVSALKHYFNVSNSYVINKLFLVLFPWRHRPWSRQQRLSHNGQDGFFLPPREDVNSPDMYIPVMAFVTYILLSTLLAGLHGAFHPELLGSAATYAFLVVVFEILVIKLAIYLLGINSESQLLDLLAYSGYKFVGIIVTLTATEMLGGMGRSGFIGLAVFFYTYQANAFFLLRSLKYVLLPDHSPSQGGNVFLPDSAPNTGSNVPYTVSRTQRQNRSYFLFLYSYGVQLFFMWILSR
ncbi:ER to Golgi transport protein-like protein Yif1 [Trichodelitschia bisporula]|uniref:Protein YIF1 n=1 Tax=Trichodelitschia bisporula TaxID=703511 RepID=A0A6G1I4G6_9PEZI|nr:ER to Golgi transport protein-like protein Yif1 [Trichodelitschia bisporula]